MRKISNGSVLVISALLLTLVLGMGCADSSTQASIEMDMAMITDMALPSPDTGIPSLTLIPSEDAPPEFIELEADGVVAYWGLTEGAVLWQTDTGYTYYSGGERTLLTDNDVEVQDAVMAQGQLLITDGVDVFTLDGLDFRPSPLSDAFEAPIRFKGIDANAFWIADRNGLHHWREQRLTHIDTQATFEDPSLTWSASSEGVDELLLWHGMSATHLKLEQTTLTELSYEFSRYPLQIGLSTKGLWTLETTRLFWLDLDQTWHYTDLETNATGLYSAGTSDTIYVVTESEFMQIRDFEVGITTRSASLGDLSVSDEGSLLNLDEGVLSVLSSVVKVNLIGAHEGPLTTARTIQAQWNDRTGPIGLVWYLDGAEVGQNGASPELVLEPAQISPGIHTLSITATFSGNRRATSQISFQGPPTWGVHIKPIAEGQCLNCHDSGAQTELFNQNQWIAEFESIQYNVETERMPLTPEKLTSRQVELIKGWGLAEFPQGEGQ